MLKLKNLSGLTFLTLIVILMFSLIFLLEKKVMAEGVSALTEKELSGLPILEETSFLTLNLPPCYDDSDVKRKIKVIVTAYSSSVWETQGDPFITASGSRVREGIIANNLLPFKTEIRLPEISGDKIFVVEDRMNSKKGYYHVDIWFPSREEALAFGAKLTEMEILSN